MLLGNFLPTGSRVFVRSPVTTDRIREFWPAGYDGASVSPDFANGAISGALQAAMTAGRQESIASSMSGGGSGDGTADAPAEVAKLFANTTTRQKGLRLAAKLSGYSEYANRIYYVNRRAGPRGEPAHTNSKGMIVFFDRGFSWDYDAIVSIIDHEVPHVRQLSKWGSFGALGSIDSAANQNEAYLHQIRSPTFRRADIEFQLGILRGMNANTRDYLRAIDKENQQQIGR